jgi:hypothetical protein
VHACKGKKRRRLARFLHARGMDRLRTTVKGMPIEDWIDQLSRLTLAVLLLATLSRMLV